MTAAFAEAHAAQDRVVALEAEKARAVAPELLAEREAQLAAALAEAHAARQHVEGLETEQATAVQQLAAALAEAHSARKRIEALEAEKAELAGHRTAELAAVDAEAQAVRERLHSLETEKAELAAAHQAAERRAEALQAEVTARQQSVADRVALELLADRESQLKAAQTALQEARQRLQSLEASTAAQSAVLQEREALLAAATGQIEAARRHAEALETDKQALLEAARTAIAPEVHAEARAGADRLEAELLKLNDQVARERLDAETLRAENARLEAAHVASQSALAELLQKKILRAPFSPVRARRVVEMSGLGAHSEVSEAEGDNFADVVSIQLPGTKRIIIRSLPDVRAYREAIAAGTEAECAAKLVEFAVGVRTHLATVESGGKELAVAFLPGDVLLGVALEQDPDLLEFAAQRGVVVATPNSLVGLLGTASASWRQHRITEELCDVRAQNQNLIEQMAAFANSFDSLRNRLGAAMAPLPAEPAAPSADAEKRELVANAAE